MRVNVSNVGMLGVDIPEINVRKGASLGLYRG